MLVLFLYIYQELMVITTHEMHYNLSRLVKGENMLP